MTPEERQRLESLAGGVPIGGYIRAQLFGETQDNRAHPRTSRAKLSLKDRQLLSKVLAQLGGSRLASNLNQLARAANSGAFPVTSDTEAVLNAAARDIAVMKRMLMAALGIAER